MYALTDGHAVAKLHVTEIISSPLVAETHITKTICYGMAHALVKTPAFENY